MWEGEEELEGAQAILHYRPGQAGGGRKICLYLVPGWGSEEDMFILSARLGREEDMYLVTAKMRECG